MHFEYILSISDCSTWIIDKNKQLNEETQEQNCEHTVFMLDKW